MKKTIADRDNLLRDLRDVLVKHNAEITIREAMDGDIFVMFKIDDTCVCQSIYLTDITPEALNKIIGTTRGALVE